MKKLIVIILLLQSVVYLSFGQEDLPEFKPSGKPLALVFTNFNTVFYDGTTMPAFEITRAYLGYEYNFSEEWYAKIIYDVGNPGAGKHQLAAYLKNAYMHYQTDRFAVSFGMISTTLFKVSEKIWGYRYLLKSYQDEYGFFASADIGANFDYQFTDFISADFSIFNGEGYKQVQGDEFLRLGAGVTVRPLQIITARIFADYTGEQVKQKSLATFLAYTGEKLIVGAEYNYQANVDMLEGYDMFGTSIYFTYKPTDEFKIFGRFDDLNSSTPAGENEPWQLEDDGQLFIAGLECTPIKGIKLAPNFRLWNPASESLENMNSVYLNCEIKF